MAIIKDESLYHSNVYLGQDYSDGIRHFKYISKKRVNGKWVYYYNDADLNKAKSNAKKAQTAYDKASAHQIKTERLEREAYNKNHEAFYDWAKSNRFNRNKRAKKVNETSAFIDQARDNNTRAKNSKATAEKLVKRSQSEVNKAQNKDKVKKALSKTAVKSLNKASNTYDKAKKAVDNVFKKLKKKK